MTGRGFDLTSLVRGSESKDGGDERWLDLSADPRLISEVAGRLADRLVGMEVEAICSWNDADSSVVAHAVASAARLPVIRVESDLGLVQILDHDHSPAVTRVAMIAPRWTAYVDGALLSSFLQSHGYDVRAVLAFIAGPHDSWPDHPDVRLIADQP